MILDTVSRLPRAQEHLKTAFTAEAVAAAHYRAYALRAEAEGLPNLAAHWRALAREKDRLAAGLLEAAGRVKGPAADLGSAVAEDSYEIEVLFPKMLDELDGSPAAAVRAVLETQQRHIARLRELQDAYQASRGDVAGLSE